MTEDLKEKIKQLPDQSGVYFFLADENVLYIGKATSLHNRVQSYFRGDLKEARSPLIEKMIAEVNDVDYQTTDSVLEALVLEQNLIKKHQPAYNSREKDNKSNSFIVFTNEEFPQVRIERGRELQTVIDPDEVEKAFGPYPKAGQLKKALKIIRKIFPYRGKRCTPAKEKEGSKPCFSYQIGLCPGVCTGEITVEKYADTVANIKLFLSGETQKLRKKLQKEMQEAADAQKFERAKELKETLFSLDHIDDVALIEEEKITAGEAGVRLEGYDVAHTAGQDMVGVMVVLEDGYAKKSDYRKFNIKTVDKSNDPKALSEIVRRRLAHTEWSYPDLFVIDGGKAQRNGVIKELKEAGVEIPVVSVVKGEDHRPKDILGPGQLIDEHRQEIMVVNSEAHRFAQSFHKKKRRKWLTN